MLSSNENVNFHNVVNINVVCASSMKSAVVPLPPLPLPLPAYKAAAAVLRPQHVEHTTEHSEQAYTASNTITTHTHSHSPSSSSYVPLPPCPTIITNLSKVKPRPSLKKLNKSTHNQPYSYSYSYSPSALSSDSSSASLSSSISSSSPSTSTSSSSSSPSLKRHHSSLSSSSLSSSSHSSSYALSSSSNTADISPSKKRHISSPPSPSLLCTETLDASLLLPSFSSQSSPSSSEASVSDLTAYIHDLEHKLTASHQRLLGLLTHVDMLQLQVTQHERTIASLRVHERQQTRQSHMYHRKYVEYKHKFMQQANNGVYQDIINSCHQADAQLNHNNNNNHNNKSSRH